MAISSGDSADLRAAGIAVAETLHRAGHQAWFVGGCVRDELLGLPLKDIDIATDARPEQLQRLWPDAHLVGATFGVVMIRHGGHPFEIATFRRDGRYIDHRHPETVSYGTLEDDANRRDFTINALYRDPVGGEIRDLVGGLADLRAGIIRCVGEPRRRFDEDALRLLRAVRFAARLDMCIDNDTMQAMGELAHTIEYVSPERQRDELTAMLTGPRPAAALRLLDQAGLLHYLLPEIVAMKGVQQGAWHPEGDVYTHTLLVLDKLEPRTTITAWAALLHDVGKPPTFRRDEAGNITFYEHQVIGADMARAIMERLRFPNDDIDAVEAIVHRHMTFPNLPAMRPATLRRFLGAPTIVADLAVHRADCLGSMGRLDYHEFACQKLEEFRARAEQVLPPPLVTGHDIIALGIPPGPRIGEILRALHERQLDGEITTRDEALAALRNYERQGRQDAKPQGTD